MSGRRALWHLAWRGARAEPLRHALVVGLIAVAVAASILVTVTVRITGTSPEMRATAEFGAADLRIEPWGGPRSTDLPAALQAEVDARHGGPLPRVDAADVDAALDDLLPAGAEVVRVPRVQGRVLPPDPTAWPVWVEVHAVDPAAPLLEGRYVGDVDRVPAAGEALLSRALQSELDVDLGDVVVLPAVGEVRVVGSVDAGPRGWNSFAVVAPGTPLGGDVRVDHFVGGLDDVEVEPLVTALDRRLRPTDAAGNELPAEASVHVSARAWWDPAGTELGERAGWVGGLVAVVLMVLVGFVAAAAFATGTRRRVREFGLLAAAAGAEPAQVRGLVRREALVLGGAGAGLGAVLGLVLTVAWVPVLERLDDRLYDLVVAPSDVAVPVVLALVSALAAAWMPASTVARVPLVAALAGRVPLRRVRRWVVPVSLTAVALGFAVLIGMNAIGAVVGRSGYQELGRLMPWPGFERHLRTLATLTGVGLLLVGAAGLAAPLLQAGARLAARLPVTGRLAIRDSARQRTRSAATVAATMAVLTVPVLALTSGASEAAQRSAPSDGPAARDDVVVVTGPTYGHAPLSAGEDAVTAVRDALPTVAAVVDLPVATTSDVDWFDLVAPSPAGEVTSLSWGSSTTFALATPELLDVLGVAGFPDDGVLVRPEDGASPASGPGGAPGRLLRQDGSSVDVTIVADPSLDHLGFATVVGRGVLDALDLEVTSTATLLQTTRPLTNADAAAVERALVAAGTDAAASVAVGDTMGPGRQGVRELLGWSFGGAVALALLIAAVTAALAATESDRDLGVMAAVGADPVTRPRFRAWQTAWHVLLGVLLAVPAGVLLALAMQVLTRYPDRTVVPWLWLAALVVVVPVAVGLPFRVCSRRSPVTAAGRRAT